MAELAAESVQPPPTLPDSKRRTSFRFDHSNGVSITKGSTTKESLLTSTLKRRRALEDESPLKKRKPSSRHFRRAPKTVSSVRRPTERGSSVVSDHASSENALPCKKTRTVSPTNTSAKTEIAEQEEKIGLSARIIWSPLTEEPSGLGTLDTRRSSNSSRLCIPTIQLPLEEEQDLTEHWNDVRSFLSMRGGPCEKKIVMLVGSTHFTARREDDFKPFIEWIRGRIDNDGDVVIVQPVTAGETPSEYVVRVTNAVFNSRPDNCVKIVVPSTEAGQRQFLERVCDEVIALDGFREKQLRILEAAAGAKKKITFIDTGYHDINNRWTLNGHPAAALLYAAERTRLSSEAPPQLCEDIHKAVRAAKRELQESSDCFGTAEVLSAAQVIGTWRAKQWLQFLTVEKLTGTDTINNLITAVTFAFNALKKLT